MGKVMMSASAPAVPSSAAMARKVKRSASASVKVKRSWPVAMQETTTVVKTPTAKSTADAAVTTTVVIEITSSPDYSGGSAKGSSRKKARKRCAPLDLDDEIEMWTPQEKLRLEENCQILDGDPLAPVEMAPTAAAGDDDVVVVAERLEVACRDFPHSRFDCVKNPFDTTPHELYCGQCCCYVCDVPAPCLVWKGTGGHCHASNKDKRWTAQRLLRKKAKETGAYVG